MRGNKRPDGSPRHLRILLSVAVALALSVATLGISHKAYAIFPHCTWTGGGGDNIFSDAANWSGCGGAPVSGAGDILTFDNSSLSQNEIITNNMGTFSFHGIQFTGTGTTYGIRIAGNALSPAIGGTLISDNTTATYPSGFNTALDYSVGSLNMNTNNLNGFYVASIVGGGLPILSIGQPGSTLEIGDLSNYGGYMEIINTKLELMPTGDMTSTALIHIDATTSNVGQLGLDDQGTAGTTYTFNLNLALDSNDQIDLDGNTSAILDGEIGLGADVNVAAAGSNTLNIIAPIADNGFTINSNSQDTATVSVASGDDQSSSSPTIGSDVTYLVDGLLGDVTVGDGGLLKGNGTVNSATVQTGGSIAPGHSPGCLTMNSGLTLAGVYDVDIQSPGNTPCTDYSQLDVGGAINLTGGNLAADYLNGFVPKVGQTFEIIQNTGGNPITGIFNGLPEGSLFSIGNTKLRITYDGGVGNSVVLTVVSVGAPSHVTAPNTGYGIPSRHSGVMELLSITGALTVAAGLYLYRFRRPA